MVHWAFELTHRLNRYPNDTILVNKSIVRSHCVNCVRFRSYLVSSRVCRTLLVGELLEAYFLFEVLSSLRRAGVIIE